MKKEKVLIGRYHLEEDRTFRNNQFECAAWYEDIRVKAGTYDVEAYFDRGRAEDIFIHLPGIVEADDFGARFHGVPVGKIESKYKGQKSIYHMRLAGYLLANNLYHNHPVSFNDRDKSRIELLDGFEAKEFRFYSTIWDEEVVTYGIIKKEDDVNEH